MDATAGSTASTTPATSIESPVSRWEGPAEPTDGVWATGAGDGLSSPSMAWEIAPPAAPASSERARRGATRRSQPRRGGAASGPAGEDGGAQGLGSGGVKEGDDVGRHGWGSELSGSSGIH